MSWFGELKQTGDLEVRIPLTRPTEGIAKLRLTIGDQSQEQTIESDDNLVVYKFGKFQITKLGYHEFRLESLSEAGQHVGDIRSLCL